MLVMERIKRWRQLFECFLCMDAFLKSISKSTADEETVYSSFNIRWTVCGCSLRLWNLVWKELQMEKKQLFSICCLTHQMAAKAEAGLGWKQEPKTFFGSPWLL